MTVFNEKISKGDIMHLLELKNIGKIYVSDNNVSVGIRGVDLSFDRGEFVAVTGKSGSGKSTLLNVISGMDTYEEGELFIDGEPTSHYLQPDWEEYRNKYISFIFQEYNIIESFSVLQNVELALMNIENPAERRKRALELLKRVGLEKHIHHKGSKLSGGQKQRTVIARALAKDSPVILADEPTGNLDSQTSREIIELLHEVSKDKLVIVVTHNFDQLEGYATRHIRIFDGSVEFDHVVSDNKAETISEASEGSAVTGERLKETVKERRKAPKKEKQHILRNGLALGRVRFLSTPKLSVFLCVLMTLVALAITFVSSMSSDALGLFDKNYMFTHINGRVVIIRTDGKIMTDDEVSEVAEKIGAKDFMHYDFMTDSTTSVSLKNGDQSYRGQFSFSYPADSVNLDAGRYPEADDEIILCVPISAKLVFGDEFEETEISELFDVATYKVTGVKYYYDNTKTPQIIFTKHGYEIASALLFFKNNYGNFRYTLNDGHYDNEIFAEATLVDFGMEKGSYFIYSKYGKYTADTKVTLSGTFNDYYIGYDDYYYYNGYDIYDTDVWYYGKEDTVSSDFDEYSYNDELSDETRLRLEEFKNVGYSEVIVLSPEIIYDYIVEQYYAKSYTQASLYFNSDIQAHSKVEQLRDMGYTAVVSDETVEQDISEVIIKVLGLIMQAVSWCLSVVFATLFLNLCSSKAMNSTRGDIAIMRSMGIPAKVIKVSIYVQTLIALIPAFLVTGIACTVIFMLPETNRLFTYMHAGEYIIIGLALAAIAVRLSRKYVKRMFSESVKKTLKGGKDI